MSELSLPACPICFAKGSLFRQTMKKAEQEFVWYECHECGSVLLWMGGGQWVYQKIGREDKTFLLKKPFSLSNLRALLPQEKVVVQVQKSPAPGERTVPQEQVAVPAQKPTAPEKRTMPKVIPLLIALVACMALVLTGIVVYNLVIKPQVSPTAIVVAPTDVPTPTPTATPAPTVPPTPESGERIPRRGLYNHAYEIQVEFDRFTSKTTVGLKANIDDAYHGRPGSLVAMYTYEGETPTPPDTVLFGFYSVHDEWEYLDCHDLYLLLDGETQVEADTEHLGDVGSGFVIETVATKFTLKRFLEIVNSTKVEGRLCRDEFELTQGQIMALRDLASRMLPQ